MSRLPRVTAKEVVKVLEKAGFQLARQSGSHAIYKNAAGLRATVPMHASEILHPKVLTRIIDSMGVTVDEFIARLNDL